MSLQYDALEREIAEAPVTWLPALLVAVVRAAIRGKVFRPGGLERVVQSTIEESDGAQS